MSNRSRIHDHYASRVHPERAGFDILDWASADAQHARFAVLARLLRQPEAPTPPPPPVPCPPSPVHRPPSTVYRPPPPALPRLLDAGCGLADLRLYLRESAVAVDYTGVDITPGILAEAQRRQPDARLLLADLFEEEPFPPRSFDVVFASGLFNLNLGNNAEFIRRGVPRLFSLASHRLVVNFLHERTAHKYGHCHYTHPEELLVEFRGLAARAEIVADYLPNDFTLVLSR